MRTALVVALLAVAVLLAACSSTPTLTDAETIWCSDIFNGGAADDAANQLGLKSSSDVWLESQGVEFDEDGSPIPSPELDAAEAWTEATLEADFEELDDWWDSVRSVWYAHPDGIRACKVAYELR